MRAAVRREWTNARRMEANEKFYQTLLQRYIVTIERPEVAKSYGREASGRGAAMSKKWGATSGGCRVSYGALACRTLCLLLFLFSGFPLFAHEVRPAYLELRQTSAETYDILWKVPGQGEDLRLGLYVQLPESCSNLTQPRGAFAANAYAERWSVQCAGGLSGGTIRIAGLSATLTDVLVRIERVEGSTQITRLTPATSSFVVEAAPSRMEIVRTYLILGIEHILTGVDHLLFVLGLLLLVRGFGKIGQNRERIHRRAQRHPSLGHARFCSCSLAAGGGGDCLEHRLCRQRNLT